MNIIIRKVFNGLVSFFVFPSYSTCLRCNKSNGFGKYHITKYKKDSGCFPLCEDCWSELTPRDKLPFYGKLINTWRSHGGSDYNGLSWDELNNLIMVSVLEGK